MRIIAFDSKKILRKQPDFKALLGVGVTIHNPSKFATEYNSVMDKLFLVAQEEILNIILLQLLLMMPVLVFRALSC